MELIKKILLAQDFSESSENVVAAAKEFAKIFQSEVVPIHVLPDDMVNEKVKSLLNEAALKKLQQTADNLNQEGVKTGQPILAQGSPHKAIVESAMDINASLIFTGSGEKDKEFIPQLGTTTQRIIQKSDLPVFVVKQDASFNIKHILCPVDFSLTSKRALKNAITMAHRFKAELTILGVCELQSSAWFTSEKDNAIENENRYDLHKVKFNKFLEGFNLSGLNSNKETRKGSPEEEILNTIAEKEIDLLIMGTSGKTGLSRFVIGSVTEKVVREMPCSFITVKSKNIITLQLETNIRDIENHYSTGMQLMEDGFFMESIDQFKHCLNISNMHVPSHYGIAKVYEKMNDPEKAIVHKKRGKEILDRIWDLKIEEEVRKLRSQ